MANNEARSGTVKQLHSSRADLGSRLLAVIDLYETREKAADVAGRSVDMLLKYTKGSTEPPFLPLARLCGDRGVRLEWLLSGEEPMLASAVREGAPIYGSQDLSEEPLTIALEITDDIIRIEREAGRAGFVPRSRYTKLLRLMYQGLTRGLPVATVYDIGLKSVRAVISGTGSEVGNVGQQGVDESGSRGDR